MMKQRARPQLTPRVQHQAQMTTEQKQEQSYKKMCTEEKERRCSSDRHLLNKVEKERYQEALRILNRWLVSLCMFGLPSGVVGYKYFYDKSVGRFRCMPLVGRNQSTKPSTKKHGSSVGFKSYQYLLIDEECKHDDDVVHPKITTEELNQLNRGAEQILLATLTAFQLMMDRLYLHAKEAEKESTEKDLEEKDPGEEFPVVQVHVHKLFSKLQHYSHADFHTDFGLEARDENFGLEATECNNLQFLNEIVCPLFYYCSRPDLTTIYPEHVHGFLEEFYVLCDESIIGENIVFSKQVQQAIISYFYTIAFAYQNMSMIDVLHNFEAEDEEEDEEQSEDDSEDEEEEDEEEEDEEEEPVPKRFRLFHDMN